MDPESKTKLEEIFNLAEENNKLLRQMRRNLRAGWIVRIVYWIFIIGAALGAYYFAQPYVEGVKDTYGGARNDIDNFNSFFDSFRN